MGDVVQFPHHTPTCFLCVHSGFAADGTTHCRMFDEPVDSEIFAARNCAGYEVE